VNVNAVALGLISTHLTASGADQPAAINVDGRSITVGVNEQILAAVEQAIPLGRPGTPEEAAGAVYLLCTPESDYISGQVIVCGGGYTF
jgi:3-oxoacyl-[acyl-carrier protein] reductase